MPFQQELCILIDMQGLFSAMAYQGLELNGGMCWQGWQKERVLYRDGLSGCVLVVLSRDPAAHLKKVRTTYLRGLDVSVPMHLHLSAQWTALPGKWTARTPALRSSMHTQVKEIAELLEDQLGLVHGWLMSVPCKVRRGKHCTEIYNVITTRTPLTSWCTTLAHHPMPSLNMPSKAMQIRHVPQGLHASCVHLQMYVCVSASKRVVGCVMLQAIQSAHAALPVEDVAASTADSSAGEADHRTPLSSRLPGPFLGSGAITPQIQVKQRAYNGMFPSAGMATQECSKSAAASRSVLSEPARTLEQGAFHLASLTTPARSGTPVPSCGLDLCHTAPVRSRKRSQALLGLPGSKRALLGSLGIPDLHAKHQLQRQQSILSGWLASTQKAPVKEVRSQC